MMLTLCKHLKRGRKGFRANCLPNIPVQELQRNPFDGFFYPLNDLSIGVLLGSTQVRFRATVPQKSIWNNMIFFYCDSSWSLKTINASEIIYRGCPKFKTYSGVRVYWQGVWFWCFPNSVIVNAFITRAGVRKTDHYFTLLNQVLVAARLCSLSVVV